MYEKVKLTKAQSEAIDSVYAAQHWSPQEFIAQHAVNSNQWVKPCDVLNEMELDTLIRAFYIGYEVQMSPEEGIKDYYDSLNRYDKCEEAEVVKKTFNILKIKIKGVN
jgi:hypothetical protein